MAKGLLEEDLSTLMSVRLHRFLSTHRPILLSVGGLEPEYDFPTQIEVLDRVRDRFPGAGLALIGSGSRQGEIERHIASKHYAEHFLLCGDVPHRTTLRTIAECDVLLRTTRYDGDSISVREALHFGTPVVATDNGMRPEGVHLIASARLDELAAAIDDVLSRTDAPERRPCDESSMAEVLELYRTLVRV